MSTTYDPDPLAQTLAAIRGLGEGAAPTPNTELLAFLSEQGAGLSPTTAVKAIPREPVPGHNRSGPVVEVIEAREAVTAQAGRSAADPGPAVVPR